MMTAIQRLTEKDFPEIFALSQFAFQYELSAEERQKKIEETKHHKIWGWMEQGTLAGKLHLHSLSCYLNGKEFAMGGIGNVATWPEYRRQGIVKHLLHHALLDMKENGQTLSFLHPFSFPFYRKYGWELAFTNKHYSLPINQLKKDWNGSGYVRRVQKDIGLLHSLYSSFAKNYNGMLVRDERWWEQRVLTGNEQIAVTYNEQDEAEGYLIYYVKNDILTVEEFVYLSLNGWGLLMQFIANHDSMVEKVEMEMPENDLLPLKMDEPRFPQEIKPYFMARIVDVPAFLKAYPFRSKNVSLPVHLHVEDDFLPDNAGSYRIEGGQVVRIEDEILEENAIFCTIQQLTVMLLGAKRPSELYAAGMFSGSPKEVELLDEMLPVRQTYLTDFF
ncbi:GNAT family N-acetyltransferase [Sediminibacillus dalangtanensis]|uniref:GNAT family N-acetyltransferase n=1 Tax=Sediminibacillus dalangtanensis TaxID=2729421 RepID=A0ABX7VY48_9BACI|nr:GNAT family N-acetyltransferase [Sediminibacillus dalangtanensis]QTN00581.1 GNAT family N-acetyltransferase [Sediminibacillus dalangtanensis]